MSILALLAGLVAQVQDPLAPAREGKLQCTLPDRAKKTCMALSRYIPLSEGRYRNETSIILSADPLMTIELTGPADIEGDAACGVFRREDMAAARVRVRGELLSASEAEPVVAPMMEGAAAGFGKKICTRMRPDGDMMVQEVTNDGVPDPQATLHFIWVRPEEGYTLAPNIAAN